MKIEYKGADNLPQPQTQDQNAVFLAMHEAEKA